MPDHYPLHRFAALGKLSPEDLRQLSNLGETAVSRSRGEIIWSQGHETRGIHLLIEGWVASSLQLDNGKRLIQKLHLPGDMMGVPSMVLPVAADTLTALTEAKTSFVSHEEMGRVFATNPRLTALMFMIAQLERLSLMDALASTGHASSTENMAHLLLDLYKRLGALGQVQDDSFPLPITQSMLGEVLGLTPVHVNRTLRDMARKGLITMRSHRVRLLDLAALRALSPMPDRQPACDPDWVPKATPAQ